MKRYILWIAATALLLAMTAGAIALYGGRTDTEIAAEELDGLQSLTREEIDSRLADATEIALDSENTVITGSGAKLSGQTVTISSAGTYRLSGTLTDGQIVVSAHNSDEVVLVLDGASIANSDSACVYVTNGTVVLYTMSGTENTMTDGETYVYASANDDEPGAAIFSKDNLILSGEGSLTVNGRYNNGIQSKDSLYITGGTLSVTAVNNAVKGKDSLKITDCALTVVSEGDGLQTSKGEIVIAGGTFDITAGNDGIQAQTALTIGGGSFTITTAGGSGNNDVISESGVSAKGLKAGTKLVVTGGTFDISAADDALHSNGSVTVSGGTFTIASGDDGVHADDALLIEDGDITITACYEGLEGTTVTMNGGTVDLTASDDGLNASGGESGETGGMGGGPQADVSSDSKLVVNGGTLTVNADGDGLDSNGTLEIHGGTVYVNGPTNDGNGALDTGTSAVIDGGTVIAVGSSGMAVTFDEDSGQCSLLYNFSDYASAGTKITLTDADGAEIVSFTAAKQFNSVVISSPALAQGETYTLAIGDQTEDVMLDGVSTTIGTGGMSGFSSGGQSDQGGGPGGQQGGGMQDFLNVDGVTVADDGTVTITAEGAQNLLDEAEEQGLTVDKTVEELEAITDRKELMELFGMGGGRGQAPSGDGGTQPEQSSDSQTQSGTAAETAAS